MRCGGGLTTAIKAARAGASPDVIDALAPDAAAVVAGGGGGGEIAAAIEATAATAGPGEKRNVTEIAVGHQVSEESNNNNDDPSPKRQRVET